MSIYERHVFVCENVRDDCHPRGCCAQRGASDVRARFKAVLKAKGLARRMRANKAGCLDQCEMGVVVVVYPDAVWYANVTPDDVEEIVDEHLVGGRVVERLAFEKDADGQLVRLAPGT